MQILKNFRSWSIGARLSLLTFLVVGAVFIAFLAVINLAAIKRSDLQAREDVVNRTALVVDMLGMFDNELRSQIGVYMKVFKSDLGTHFSLDPARTIDVAGVAMPILKADSLQLTANFSLPDRFLEQTGGIATVFVKQGDDFVRIGTSLKKENGERATGTKLDHAHPAYKSVLEGKSYVGNATLFGRQYMTQYDPIEDGQGRIVGILFVGLDFNESIKQIKDKVRAIKIGETGYFYAIDAKEGKDRGTLTLHPSKEGQNVLESKDNSGHAFVKEMLERREGVIRYPWINAERGETEPRDKLVAFYPMNNWNWIVAGGIYADEYTRESSRQILRFQLIGAILLLAMGAGLYWAMRRSLSDPLQIAIAQAKQLAGGDLTGCVEVTRVDEIGQLMAAINSIGQGLALVVHNVRESTGMIVRSSAEIASGNADLSARTESQANSLQETAASMQELTGTVKQNSESAEHANALVVSASDLAAKGGLVVSQVMETMASIKESSRKVVDIISVIDGIAFQTNILALNAAVEAARAGEQGRGFAVVASEVRNLAQRSASAAKEIKNLIGDSVEKIEAGNLLVQQTSTTMNGIVVSVTRVANIMAEISSAGREQSSGIEQVTQAVEKMDEMTQHNAALVEEAAATAQHMRDQAASLAKAISAFKMKAD